MMAFGNTIPMAHKALDYLWKRMEVINQNLANIETPEYKNKTLSFEETYRQRLQNASMMKGTNSMSQAIAGTDYYITEQDSSGRVDKNNVSVDVENTKLARTDLHYQYLLQSVTNDHKRFESVLRAQ